VKIDELPSVYLNRLRYDTVTFSPYTPNLARDLVGADHLVMGGDYPHLLGSIDRAACSIEGPHIRSRRSKEFSQHVANVSSANTLVKPVFRGVFCALLLRP